MDRDFEPRLIHQSIPPEKWWERINWMLLLSIVAGILLLCLAAIFMYRGGWGYAEAGILLWAVRVFLWVVPGALLLIGVLGSIWALITGQFALAGKMALVALIGLGAILIAWLALQALSGLGPYDPEGHW